MDPRPSGRRPVFATRSPPGYHSDDITQTQPHLQDGSSYPTRTDQQNDGSHRSQGLNVIQIASANPVPRCRYLDSQMVLEEITFWTNVCNMWLLDNKQEQQQQQQQQQPGYAEHQGGEGIMMDGSSHSQEVPYASAQEHGFSNANEGGPPGNHHHYPPTGGTHPNIHSNGVEAIHAALHRHNAYDESIMPISIAAAPPLQQPYHPHPSSSSSSSPSGTMIQSTATTTTTTTARTTARDHSSSSSSSISSSISTAVADYKNNNHHPYGTMPRRGGGGRRDWRGQVPRPAGLQTRAEREFNGVDVYGRYRPD